VRALRGRWPALASPDGGLPRHLLCSAGAVCGAISRCPRRAFLNRGRPRLGPLPNAPGLARHGGCRSRPRRLWPAAKDLALPVRRATARSAARHLRRLGHRREVAGDACGVGDHCHQLQAPLALGQARTSTPNVRQLPHTATPVAQCGTGSRNSLSVNTRFRDSTPAPVTSPPRRHGPKRPLRCLLGFLADHRSSTGALCP
jgi:hypothetical protein